MCGGNGYRYRRRRRRRRTAAGEEAATESVLRHLSVSVFLSRSLVLSGPHALFLFLPTDSEVGSSSCMDRPTAASDRRICRLVFLYLLFLKRSPSCPRASHIAWARPSVGE